MIIVDHTHLGRHVTGIERVTLGLFSAQALQGLDARFVTSQGTASLIWQQMVRLPVMALANPASLILCPGFPPSIPLSIAAGARVIPYIHDLFLLTRRDTLNPRAKLYMAPALGFAVRRLTRFMVNSRWTETELRRFCRPDARILMCRPRVDNVFGLAPRERDDRTDVLKMVMVGTIEPRKNYPAAAVIRDALEARLGRTVELHVIGRQGWGEDATLLAGRKGVVLHGYLDAATARAVIGGADVFLSTSQDEGLGLPLLEAQYAGLPVVAPDLPVFREVLGDTGTFIRCEDAASAAESIAGLVSAGPPRSAAAALALANLERWNQAADDDKATLMATLRDWSRQATPRNAGSGGPS